MRRAGTAQPLGTRDSSHASRVKRLGALIRDGVAPDKIYEVLATAEGQNRAFKKLGTIKDQMIWWSNGAQTPQLLADGEVVMGSTYNGRLFSVIEEEKQPIAMLWDRQVFDLEGWISQAWKMASMSSR